MNLSVEEVKHKLPLNQEWIDPQALKLVKKLQSHNHTTYLVGGCVRDLLIGLPPKDFDIATSALPKEVNKIIRPSYIIGRRFKLVLVKRYGEQYEISTFRTQSDDEDEEGSLITDDNTFGTSEDDARRRDFTINSFFYDPVEQELIDYCGGLKDIEKRVVRMIGDPEIRIQEDPLRMLRAIRFAYKSQFSIEPTLREAIFNLADQIQLTVLPRKREELLKFLRLDSAAQILWECHDLNLLKHLSPTLDEALNGENADLFISNLNKGLNKVTDDSNSHELFAVLLFSLINSRYPDFCEKLDMSKNQKESLSHILREEWGMFRNEQDLFFQSLRFIQQLRDIKSVKKLRNRYIAHLSKSNSMPIALTLSIAYKLLPENEIYYWLGQYWKENG